MVHGGCFRILGLTVEIKCLELQVGRSIATLFSPFAMAPGEDEIGCHFELSVDADGNRTLASGETVIADGPSWHVPFSALARAVNRRAIDAFSGLAVHSGVVASDDLVVAFPAESGAGKSTLTAACLQAGFRYISDEALCLDYLDGRVIRYPKPLSLSPASLDLLGLTHSAGAMVEGDGELLATAETLGSSVHDEPARLAHIVVPVRTAGPPRLVPLAPAAGLAVLLQMSFNHYKRPQATFDLVTRLANHARTWRLESSCPRAAAELLRAAMDA